jgi:hypothetical protein
MVMKCPIATQDIHVNLKNRNHAFKEYGYGPANPELPNEAFWNDKANEWQTEVRQAKSMRCGNCAAFIQTPEMLECIKYGIDEEEGYAEDVMKAANLGYCELFDFKCAADRTCSAWLVGGPITSSKVEVDDDALDDSIEEM